MTIAVAEEETRRPAPRARPPLWIVAIFVLAGIVFTVRLLALAVDTGPGHALLLRTLEQTTFSDGLNFRARRLEGSVWGRMTLRDVEARDAQGLFARSPALSLQWRPAALIDRWIDLPRIGSDEIEWLRAPRLKVHAPRPNAPILPDIHLTVGRLEVKRLQIGGGPSAPALAVKGDGVLRGQRLRVRLDAASAGQGGDRLHLALDAAPKADRLALDAHLAAPAGGAVDALVGLRRPLTFDLAGQGSWRLWRGRAQAQLGGARALDATVEAQAGRLHVRGALAPSRLAPQAPVLGRLASAGFDVRASLEKRHVGLAAALTGPGVAARAAGGLDLAHNRYETLVGDARLADPAILGPAFSGRDLAASVRLDGAMAAPTVQWSLAAANLTLGKIGIEGLAAKGGGQGAAGRPMALTVSAAARHVAGLPPIVEPIASDVRLSGPWSFDHGRIVAKGLALASSRLAARADLDLLPAKGVYSASASGHIAAYPVEGVGLFDLDVQTRFSPAGKGQIAIDGEASAHSDRLDDATVRSLVGGEARAQGRWSVTPLGEVQVLGLTLAAPRLKVPSASLHVDPQGVLALRLDGVSNAYGAFHFDLDGLAETPTLHLVVPHPNLADLSGVDATMSTRGHSLWTLDARAASPLGPASAQARLDFSRKDLAIDIAHGKVGEIALSGPLTVAPGGVLTGALRLVGSGFSGEAALDGPAGVQRVVARLSARQAHIDTHPRILVASGESQVTLTLSPGEPLVVGHAALTGLTRGRLHLGRASLEVNYQGGRGRISGSIQGEDRAPFSGAGTIDLAPGLVRIAGSGVANGVAVRLAAPAELRKFRADWTLAPATLLLPSGQLTLSGRDGPGGVAADAKLTSVDMALVRAAAPDLAVSGVASGVAKVRLPANGDLPTGQVQLQVANFTRAGLSAVSEPIDVSVLGNLTPSQGDLHAVIRRRGVVVGRLQASLSPIPAAGDWKKRLAAAPLTGGLRWNGPAEALWGLTGQSGYSFSGPLAIGVDVTGALDRPQTRGIVQAQGLRFVDESLGAVIDDIALSGRFEGERLQIDKLQGRAGDGTVVVAGSADLAQTDGFPIDLSIALRKARLARNAQLGATVSGDLKISNDRAHGAQVAGRLGLDQASYRMGVTSGPQTVELSGVRRKDEPLAVPISAAPAPVAPGGPPSVWKLDIGVAGAGNVRVTGLGLDAQWRPALTVKGDARHPILTGEIDLVRGDFTFAGRKLGLTRGIIRLNGADPPDPTLDIDASTSVEGVTANVQITGLSSHPEVTFTSSPVLPQDEVLSRLLFGASTTNISPVQAVELAASLNELRGGGGGLKSLGALQRAAGLRFYAADKTTGRGAAFGAGRSLTRNIYVEITSDTRGYAVTQIEVALSRALRLLSQVGTVGGGNLSLTYTKTY